MVAKLEEDLGHSQPGALREYPYMVTSRT